MSDEAFDAICSFVESDLGFATSHYNDSYLDRRISSRIRRTNSEGYEAYADLLRSDPDEQTALLDSFSINVTGFFRNPDVWDGVRSVLRSLSASNETVHVWSAACADGREAYSLAMLARDDPEIDESSVYVLGTDISDPALETARQGVYRRTRTTDIDDQLSYLETYEDYVECEDDCVRIRPTLSETVRFERHDLINDEPKSGFDLVICRNLFIYIDPAYKESMLETIARSLRPGGYLVIGKAETIPPSLKATFTIHDGRLRIYRVDSTDGSAPSNG
ncbi:CheR family methyltransferase [Halovivax limisalsi]|uniref:CheR family methyltransferase n=1 Tax=Halovivax limisalsi TaxID=1453760 RepID=UPI001FFC9CC8|nr:protein-glutamate O-methyltransferase CheR [Halovivax limisalsi]